MNISIIRPIAATVAGTFTNPERMASPDPKEVAYTVGAGAKTIDLDLGSVQDVGAIYLGGVSGTTSFAVTGGAASYTTTNFGNIVVAPSRSGTAPRQYLLTLDASLRYIRLSANLADGFEVGIAFAGERFTPEWNQEYGAGRYLIDTSAVARNRAGGFGIDEGAIIPGYEFTLGDLSDEEAEALFELLRKVGESRPMLVCEDATVSSDLDARTHYGLFQRIEKYERRSINVTRWSLKLERWI